ncbi:MAG: zinc dependent phospholipase C family protein [Lachnospiraceae bacterium]|nr:zinc dependent phospholipase C family protein [Lachnospiraceae bacterium]
MRKKSHIALAHYLIRQDCTENILKYKKAFYLGSILPDLSPKMFAVPHEYVSSYTELQAHIRGLTDGWYAHSNPHMFWRRLGVVLHYLADYFTYPHNTTYEGSLADHCIYEGDMKHSLREYVKTEEAEKVFRMQKYGKARFESADELLSYIENMHARYLQSKHTVESDCRWIVEMCSLVLLSITYLMEQNARNGVIQLGAWVA